MPAMDRKGFLLAGCQILDVVLVPRGFQFALGTVGKGSGGFSKEPLDGFRHLRADLERYAQVFLTGTDEQLVTLLSHAEKLVGERPKGVLGLP